MWKELKNKINNFFAAREAKKSVCVKCVHCSKADGIGDHFCQHPIRKNEYTDYITGDKITSYDYCIWYNTQGTCGLFEAKEEK